eukprot:TRINITY_DN104_c0_g3_i1.p1 TRINITY_DN104_c0_g3~~TRINITY_DN104_c0_g3_i1.p1  ORF type:complete len:942 (-),score=132.43 TRINITY_DN104_c0_g3_i1:208-3033(-)
MDPSQSHSSSSSSLPASASSPGANITPFGNNAPTPVHQPYPPSFYGSSQVHHVYNGGVPNAPMGPPQQPQQMSPFYAGFYPPAPFNPTLPAPAYIPYGFTPVLQSLHQMGLNPNYITPSGMMPAPSPQPLLPTQPAPYYFQPYNPAPINPSYGLPNFINAVPPPHYPLNPSGPVPIPGPFAPAPYSSAPEIQAINPENDCAVSPDTPADQHHYSAEDNDAAASLSPANPKKRSRDQLIGSSVPDELEDIPTVSSKRNLRPFDSKPRPRTLRLYRNGKIVSGIVLECGEQCALGSANPTIAALVPESTSLPQIAAVVSATPAGACELHVVAKSVRVVSGSNAYFLAPGQKMWMSSSDRVDILWNGAEPVVGVALDEELVASLPPALPQSEIHTFILDVSRDMDYVARQLESAGYTSVALLLSLIASEKDLEEVGPIKHAHRKLLWRRIQALRAETQGVTAAVPSPLPQDAAEPTPASPEVVVPVEQESPGYVEAQSSICGRCQKQQACILCSQPSPETAEAFVSLPMCLECYMMPTSSQKGSKIFDSEHFDKQYKEHEAVRNAAVLRSAMDAETALATLATVFTTGCLFSPNARTALLKEHYALSESVALTSTLTVENLLHVLHELCKHTETCLAGIGGGAAHVEQQLQELDNCLEAQTTALLSLLDSAVKSLGEPLQKAIANAELSASTIFEDFVEANARKLSSARSLVSNAGDVGINQDLNESLARPITSEIGPRWNALLLDSFSHLVAEFMSTCSNLVSATLSQLRAFCHDGAEASRTVTESFFKKLEVTATQRLRDVEAALQKVRQETGLVQEALRMSIQASLSEAYASASLCRTLDDLKESLSNHFHALRSTMFKNAATQLSEEIDTMLKRVVEQTRQVERQLLLDVSDSLKEAFPEKARAEARALCKDLSISLQATIKQLEEVADLHSLQKILDLI